MTYLKPEHRMSNLFRSVVLTSAAMSLSTVIAAEKPADVPVRQVMLFSSGVGYFEHSGTVSGDAKTQLAFKTDQINDILKSLILEDLDDGSVSAITYPSQDPIEKTLRSFQIDIADNPDLAQLLLRLRGASVSLETPEGKLDGTVLGVESKPVAGGNDQQPLMVAVVNLLSGGTIRAIELRTVRAIQLQDAALQEELNKALSALAAARDQDKKPVVIDFAGKGDRRVRLGYVVQTPVWKTSYRLVLGDEADGDDADAKAGRLQGWAIVENQTDNDWNDVKLSLVSGRPISFVQDLYQPLYIQRPVVEPELYSSLRPQRYQDGMRQEQADANQPMQMKADRRVRSNRPTSEAAPMAAPAFSVSGGAVQNQAIDLSRSVSSVAQAAEVGELFQYTVPAVTLARRSSAMLPIVTEPIEAQRISIYNQSVLATHPLNGARLKNTTDKHLLAGPITLFDGGGYAGDAQIENLPPGQERLLSYGIDLKVAINATSADSKADITAGRIVKGVLEITHKNTQSRTYQIDNKADRARTLIVEHPVSGGWELIDSPKPIETTEAVYRFQSSVPAQKQEKLKITQQRISRQSIAILPLELDALAAYHSTAAIGDNVKAALARAIELKQAVVATERRIDEIQAKLNTFPDQQSRIRENMRVIDRTSDLYADYMKRLKTQETTILTLQNELEAAKQKLDEQRKALEAYLSGLDVG